MSTATAEKIFGNSGETDELGRRIVVKEPSDRYSAKKYVAANKHGKPVLGFDGREVETASRKELAQFGALLKFVARRGGENVMLNEHEKELVNELGEKATWAGTLNGVEADAHDSRNVKALLDDSTSGGLEIVPTVFDNMLVSTPLLGNELLPEVTLVDVPRGRRIEGAAISTPTATWGEGDDSDLTLFSTTGMVSAIDTTIHPLTVSLELGRDFISDTPLNIGMELSRLIGQRFAKELDKVIAVGNGSIQPEGVMTASGLSTVSFGSAAPTVGGYESLLFSVPKELRGKFCFVGNETSYQRAMSVAVGASDARRMFGDGFFGTSNHEGYQLFGRPFKICHDLSNSQSFAGNLRDGYRLYRRLGLSMEWHSSGKTLARRNLALLIVRARFGGQVVLADCLTQVTDHQA